MLRNRLSAICLVFAGVNGFIAVAAGAYGRHGVTEAYPRELFAIASQYQVWHALTLLAVAWIAESVEARWLSAAGFAAAAFTLGIVLFSGTLYAFALSGGLPTAGAAPVGGFLLMAGWLTFVWIGVQALFRR